MHLEEIPHAWRDLAPHVMSFWGSSISPLVCLLLGMSTFSPLPSFLSCSPVPSSPPSSPPYPLLASIVPLLGALVLSPLFSITFIHVHTQAELVIIILEAVDFIIMSSRVCQWAAWREEERRRGREGERERGRGEGRGEREKGKGESTRSEDLDARRTVYYLMFFCSSIQMHRWGDDAQAHRQSKWR